MLRHMPAPRVLRAARVLTIVLIGVLPFAAARPLEAARPLHAGARGAPVAGLQWMLAGHRPSVYRTTIRTFHGKPNGLYGRHTRAAVYWAKWRLGFPTRALDQTAGRDFLLILKGKQPRPLGYIVRAQHRVQTVKPLPVKPSCIRRLIASEKQELGVVEHPDGSNDGQRVHVYQSATGVYRRAWCMSFQVFEAVKNGLGDELEHTAGVYEETRWGKAHSLIHAVARAGSIVLFQDWGRPNGGHAGLVIKVFAHGFVSIEGNASNGVRERYHTLNDRQPLFLWLPGCSS